MRERPGVGSATIPSLPKEEEPIADGVVPEEENEGTSFVNVHTRHQAHAHTTTSGHARSSSTAQDQNNHDMPQETVIDFDKAVIEDDHYDDDDLELEMGIYATKNYNILPKNTTFSSCTIF